MSQRPPHYASAYPWGEYIMDSVGLQLNTVLAEVGDLISVR